MGCFLSWFWWLAVQVSRVGNSPLKVEEILEKYRKMKALILAAGFGTRLAPLTHSLPKCLVELAGRPLLQHWLSAFEASCVISEIVINTHYLSEQVDEFIKRWPSKKNIIVKHETHLLGTAGTIRSLKEWVGTENLMVVHGDNFTSLNLDHFINAHLARPVGTYGTMGYFTCEDFKIVEL